MSQKHRLLIIDDDRKLSKLLSDYLSPFGFEVLSASKPGEGLQYLKTHAPELIILDVMLPDINGFDLCKIIRQDHTIPIIMLTARGEVTDRVVGLELGADDYLAKPFEPRELVARIQAVLRRSADIPMPQIRSFGRLTIDSSRRTAALDEQPLSLTTNEFAALALLARNAGRVLNRDQILQELRGIDSEAFNRTVDITISRLRQKLSDDPQNPSFIKTVWGTGYVFVGTGVSHNGD